MIEHLTGDYTTDSQFELVRVARSNNRHRYLGVKKDKRSFLTANMQLQRIFREIVLISTFVFIGRRALCFGPLVT